MDPAIPAPPPFPVELQPYRSTVQAYVNAKIKQFAGAFNRRLRLNLDPANLDACVQETMLSLASLETNNTRALRLVLRHDCQSTGCGETGCLLCQFNPSRLCKRNIKNKYLIDDHLKAKCGAPLRVELVDETNACVVEGLPDGMQLESHVMNGEKYKEICPENTLLSHAQLRSCIIAHHTKALLRRDGGSDEQLRCFLQLERGQAVLSDLQVTTSSEALLAGKAPTFRLLIWAVDAQGEPVPSVTYVVSEYFVVATKRVKHAIKSDIPSVSDNVSKLVHIGKATVDKLMDLRSAAAEEGFEISVPDELNRVDKVGQFQQLVELSEMNTDLKNKVRHLLKLSPEKWEEVANHAQAAVMPDFRPRAWWCPALKAGLLFSCKNGSVCMDQPIALVKMAGKGEDDQVIPIAQLDVQLFNTIPKLKAQAVQSWYAQSHPGWAIYWKDGQQDPTIQTAVLKEQEAAGHSPSINTAGPPAYSGQSAGPRRPSSTSGATAASMFAIGQPPNIPLLPPTAADPRPTSPFHFHAPAQQNQGQLLQAQPPPLSLNGGPNMQALNPGGGMNGNSKSPFAAETLMGGIQADFPAWPNQPPGAASAVPNQPGQAPQADSMNLSLMINTLAGGSMAGQAGLMGVPGALDGLQTDLDLNRGMSQFNTSFGMENPSTLWGLNTTNLPSMLAGTGSLNASLNQMMQEQAGVYPTMERAGSGEPPSKLQRTMPPEEGQAA